MNDQNPDPTPAPIAPPTVTMTAEDFDAAIDEAVERGRASVKSSDSTPTRFAVYDTVYARFVGEVVDSKSAATKAAKDAGLTPGAFQVREV